MKATTTHSSDLTAQIEQMVSFDRVGDAIELLLAITPSGSKFRDELIGHGATLHRIARNERLGLATAANAEARTRLAQAVLELSKLVTRRSIQNMRPLPMAVASTISVPEEASLEKIIGANNLKKIAWLEQGLRCAAAVGRIVCRGHTGTAFMISGNRVATNHHVLPSADKARDAVIEFNYQEDLAGRLLQHFAYRLDPTRFWTTGASLDISVVGVLESDSAPALERWGVLVPNFDKPPSRGDHVSIIQHPEGGVKQIACTANQVVNLYEHRLQYLTDTLPGSSGAPVFDDDWRVVAIHHAGGNMKTNSHGDTRYVNEGILLSTVAHLLAR